MMIRRILLTCCLITSVESLQAAERFIVENGEPRAEIVISDKPERSVRIAADDLQTYVSKLSGARLPIVTAPTGKAVKLFVGRSPHTEKLGITEEGLKYGAYRLVSGDDWMVFLGDDTDFTPIEPWARGNGDLTSGKFQAQWDEITGKKWGLPPRIYKHRFQLPGDVGLPDAQRTGGKLDPVEHWSFDERGSHNAVCGFLQKLGVRWYMPGELGEVVPETKTIPLKAHDETVRPDFEIRRFNARYSGVSPDTIAWCIRLGMRDPYDLLVAHGMAAMTSRKEVFAEHPEWFALYGGKRDYDPSGRKNQLCYSNDELLQEAVQYARALFDHYDYEGVSIMPPDGYTAICQCPLCAGKDEPERGNRGSLSNHVWDFVNRVAKETGKTHPNKQIVCCAYGANTQPPTNIDRLEPNVQVVIVGGRRPKSGVAAQVENRQLREGWYAKTARPIMIFENYPFTDRSWYLPTFMARTIGSSINETKGHSRGEDIWLSFGADFEQKDLGFNHFQVYFTARMYWGGPQQDAGLLLAEYCKLFYGSAGEAMQTFFDHCEAHWEEMETDKSQADVALDLFSAAKAKVDPSSVYGRRIVLIDQFLDGLRRKGEQLAQKRGPVPTLRLIGEARDVVIDGNLDDAFWQRCPTAATGQLRELQTGRAATYGTSFKAGRLGDSLYFAIRCEERPGEKLNVTATKREDSALWYGDCVEIHLATDVRTYYQIAVNPAGALVDLDRSVDKGSWSRWDSQAEVATRVAEDHWTVEIRIPVTRDENDPLHQVIGRQPTQSLPWYFNIGRQRIRENGTEFSAYSPTATGAFHVPIKFARLFQGKSKRFESDPNATDFILATRAAEKLSAGKQHAEAIAAFVALAEGAQGKVTDLQKSAALKHAIGVARIMKDFAQAEVLAAKIPIEAERKNAEMLNLLAQRQVAELVERFGAEDLTKWPFWAAGEGYFTRGRAYALLGNDAMATFDFEAALSLTTDPRIRADLLEALGRKGSGK